MRYNTYLQLALATLSVPGGVLSLPVDPSTGKESAHHIFRRDKPETTVCDGKITIPKFPYPSAGNLLTKYPNTKAYAVKPNTWKLTEVDRAFVDQARAKDDNAFASEHLLEYEVLFGQHGFMNQLPELYRGQTFGPNKEDICTFLARHFAASPKLALMLLETLPGNAKWTTELVLLSKAVNGQKMSLLNPGNNNPITSSRAQSAAKVPDGFEVVIESLPAVFTYMQMLAPTFLKQSRRAGLNFDTVAHFIEAEAKIAKPDGTRTLDLKQKFYTWHAATLRSQGKKGFQSIQTWSMAKLNVKIEKPIVNAVGPAGMPPSMKPDNTLKGKKRPNPPTPVVSNSNLPPAAKKLETTAGGVPAQNMDAFAQEVNQWIAGAQAKWNWMTVKVSKGLA